MYRVRMRQIKQDCLASLCGFMWVGSEHDSFIVQYLSDTLRVWFLGSAQIVNKKCGWCFKAIIKATAVGCKQTWATTRN